MDHDRAEGEGVAPQEYTAIKIELLETEWTLDMKKTLKKGSKARVFPVFSRKRWANPSRCLSRWIVFFNGDRTPLIINTITHPFARQFIGDITPFRDV